MVCELVPIIIVLATAIFTGADAGGEPPGRNGAAGGINTAGTLANETNPTRGTDPEGVSVNDEELHWIYEEEISNLIGNSIKERKICSPSISCTRAGGHCVKNRGKCNGTVDPQGCKGGKKCKCCIPDHTTQPPVTCPTTQPICTCPTCATPTADITTTPSVTTKECPAPWFLIGNQCFRAQARENPHQDWNSIQWLSWSSARANCRAQGGDLAQPKDLKALAEYLLGGRLGISWWFIGGSDTSKEGDWLWLNGTSIASTEWYQGRDNDPPQPAEIGHDEKDCLYLSTWSGSRGLGALYSKECEQRSTWVCERH